MHKKIIFLSLAAVMTLGITSFVLADSQLSLAGLDIKAAEGAITGFLKLANSSDKTLNNLSYSFILESPQGMVMAIQDELGSNPEDSKFFSIMPKEELTKNFVFLFPKNLKSGDYNLRISVLDFGGEPVANYLQKVALKGENKFLDIDPSSCRLLLDKKEFAAQSGIPFYPGEPVKISCKVSNPNSVSSEITPVLRVKEFSLFSAPQAPFSEITGKTVSFKPKESANVTLEFSSIPQKPQIYEAGLKFEDSSGEQVSGYAIFRWLIKGLSTRLTSFELDKDTYANGDIAKASFKFTVSPDMYFMYYPQFAPKSLEDDTFRLKGAILKDASVTLAVKNEKGECGKKTAVFKNLNPSADKDYSQTVEIVIDKTCRDPRAEIVLSSADQILASAAYQAKSPAEKPKPKINGWYVIITMLAIAAIIAVIKIMGRKPPSKIVSSI